MNLPRLAGELPLPEGHDQVEGDRVAPARAMESSSPAIGMWVGRGNAATSWPGGDAGAMPALSGQGAARAGDGAPEARDASHRVAHPRVERGHERTIDVRVGEGSAPAPEDVEGKAEHEAAGNRPALLTRTPNASEHELCRPLPRDRPPSPLPLATLRARPARRPLPTGAPPPSPQPRRRRSRASPRIGQAGATPAPVGTEEARGHPARRERPGPRRLVHASRAHRRPAAPDQARQGRGDVRGRGAREGRRMAREDGAREARRRTLDAPRARRWGSTSRRGSRARCSGSTAP